MTFTHNLLSFEELLENTSQSGRIYTTPEGYEYPSVTTFLRQIKDDTFLKKWKQRVGEQKAKEILEESGRRGTQIHTMCERFLLNETKITSDQLSKDVKFFQTLQPIIKRKIDNIRALEAPLYSHALKLAGRVDCVADWTGELAIIDFKNARSPRKEEWVENYFWQETIYSIMLQERTGLVAKKLVTLIAVENENYPQVFVKERKDYIRDVLKAVKEFNFSK